MKKPKQISIETLQQLNKIYTEILEIDHIITQLDKVAKMTLDRSVDIQLSINAIESLPANNTHTPSPLLFVPGYGYFEPVEVPHAKAVTRVDMPESTTLVLIETIAAERRNRKEKLLADLQTLTYGRPKN